MNYWLFVGGALIVLFIFMDALWTTLWSEGGAGPLTDRISTIIWKGFKKVAGAGGSMNHFLLSLAGPVVLVVTVVTWLLLMWTGMVMMFGAHPDAVVVALTKNPGDLTDRIWFVLFTTTTVGNGGFAPNTDFFQVLAGFIGASGMAMMTLAITYSFQVLSAVVNKRTFASQVLSLGETTSELVRALQHAPPSSIATQLSSMGERLGSITEQHKAYPVLHYFHPSDRHRSTACAVAAIDEALRIYCTGLSDDDIVVDTSVFQPLRRTIGTFLEELRESYLVGTEESPPRADIGEMRQQGADISHPQRVHEAAEEEDERRKLLEGLVSYDGWQWDDVVQRT
ncbi:two pore domain potassium channel family protein [Persicimonas caeni]|uniref:Two pore domain potassium channel family protein n=1 Tax=Persicimonas caeni TaxID=2292766 RepID=A0A4Y6PXF5_PERCE|nr:potassium channel family protein [Persicimonas caeni]QDG53011.1 two pore domain potassium channel family protein [Persicimonas caeni]QED34233.1 two pore domain potassium channel family protein [Persicimonas caeni]